MAYSQGQQLGSYQIIRTTLSGIVICIALSAILATLIGIRSQPPVGIEIIAIIIGAFVLCLPLFFGAVFGRLTGLLTGGIGPLVGLAVLLLIFGIRATNTLFPFIQYSTLFSDCRWSFYPGLALAGFISGYAPLKMKGRYNLRRSLGFSFLGILVALTAIFTIFAIIPNTIFSDGSIIETAIGVAILYNLCNLIILPILLLIYHNSGD